MYIDFEEIGKIAADDIGIFTGPVDGPIRVEPVKEPPILYDDSPVYPVKFRMFNYSGTVVDSVTGEPIQSATVSVMQGDSVSAMAITNSQGEFFISVEGQAEAIEITAAEYKGWKWPASEQQHKFELERKVKDLPPVLLPGGAGGNSMLWLLLLGGAVVYNESQKKKVGKVDTGTVVAVGAGVLLLTGFSVVKKLLEGIGIFQSQDGKDYEQHLSNPGSFWNPGFWEKGPSGTKLITQAGCEWLYNEIYDSFGFWGDDENRIYAAFKTLTTQSQLSYFAWWLLRNKNMDLLRWLHGSNFGPVGDHLSVSEIAVITDYFKRLPQWK